VALIGGKASVADSGSRRAAPMMSSYTNSDERFCWPIFGGCQQRRCGCGSTDCGLGRTSDTELARLIELAASTNLAPPSPRRVGRPAQKALIAGFDPIFNVAIRAEWHALTKEFRTLSKLRDKHHAPMNRTRGGQFHSPEWRIACRESKLGKRAVQANLFNVFFDHKHLTPQEMAAQLLLKEIRGRTTASPSTNAPIWRSRATPRGFPTWRTFYKKLRSGRR
jgi:hypothetical protein